MIKKLYIYISFLFLSFINYSYSFEFSEDSMLPKWTNKDIKTIVDVNGETIVDNLLKYTKETLTWLIMVVAIWAFLYVWFKLVVARGNPEEFKKAIQTFIYTIVWIVLVWMAWAFVSLVASIKF